MVHDNACLHVFCCSLTPFFSAAPTVDALVADKSIFLVEHLEPFYSDPSDRERFSWQRSADRQQKPFAPPLREERAGQRFDPMVTWRALHPPPARCLRTLTPAKPPPSVQALLTGVTFKAVAQGASARVEAPTPQCSFRFKHKTQRLQVSLSPL